MQCRDPARARRFTGNAQGDAAVEMNKNIILVFDIAILSVLGVCKQLRIRRSPISGLVGAAGSGGFAEYGVQRHGVPARKSDFLSLFLFSQTFGVPQAACIAQRSGPRRTAPPLWCLHGAAVGAGFLGLLSAPPHKHSRLAAGGAGDGYFLMRIEGGRLRSKSVRSHQAFAHIELECGLGPLRVHGMQSSRTWGTVRMEADRGKAALQARPIGADLHPSWGRRGRPIVRWQGRWARSG